MMMMMMMMMMIVMMLMMIMMMIMMIMMIMMMIMMIIVVFNMRRHLYIHFSCSMYQTTVHKHETSKRRKQIIV